MLSDIIICFCDICLKYCRNPRADSRERVLLEPGCPATLHSYTAHTQVYSTHRFPLDSLMRITFVTDLGATYTVEIDPKMELENVMALLEAEVGGINCSLPMLMSFLAPSPVFPSPNKVSRMMVGN